MFSLGFKAKSLEARAAGRAFHDHLLQNPTNAQSPYEQTFIANHEKMIQLERFCDQEPPVLLWRGQGRFAALFRFLSARFLSCPDHVLDSEGVHALWKWIEASKRALSFKMLNALLKLEGYLREYGSFPDHAELNPHIMAIGEGLLAQYRAVRADGQVAPGATWQHIYADRFNLRATDIELIRAPAAGGPVAERTAVQAFSNYIRFLFEAGHIYCLNNLNDKLFFLVARTRSAPGKEAATHDEAQGRSLAIVWMEKFMDVPEGIHIRPVAGRTGELHMELCTVSEIARAAGYFPQVEIDDTAAIVEAKYEEKLLSFEVIHFDSVRIGEDVDPWGFILSNPVDVETLCFNTRGVVDLTKMALARKLQLNDGTSDALRAERWQLSKDNLLAALALALDGGAVARPAAAGAGAAVAPPAIRGRGGRGGRGAGAAGPVAPAVAAAVADTGRGRGGRGDGCGRGRRGGRGG